MTAATITCSVRHAAIAVDEPCILKGRDDDGAAVDRDCAGDDSSSRSSNNENAGMARIGSICDFLAQMAADGEDDADDSSDGGGGGGNNASWYTDGNNYGYVPDTYQGCSSLPAVVYDAIIKFKTLEAEGADVSHSECFALSEGDRHFSGKEEIVFPPVEVLPLFHIEKDDDGEGSIGLYFNGGVDDAAAAHHSSPPKKVLRISPPTGSANVNADAATPGGDDRGSSNDGVAAASTEPVFDTVVSGEKGKPQGQADDGVFFDVVVDEWNAFVENDQ